jgi:predicted cation transporter
MWLIGGLTVIMGMVLVLPFLSRKVEEELEIFLFLMGIISVSISKVWTWHLVYESAREPIIISLAVLLAGTTFRISREWLRNLANKIIKRFGLRPLIFLLVTGLGMLSSIITAIIAALILAEIISVIKLGREMKVKIVVIACLAIGLGAALTPIGEPLATVVVSKLRTSPHYADFFYLMRLLGPWIILPILGLGVLAASHRDVIQEESDYTCEAYLETYKDILARTVKVYFFVMALMLLGAGMTPMVERYFTYIPARVLYWINMVSAILDNATLAVAEITPRMNQETIQFLLLGLLSSGGMLIPGNIPNIVCAGKLSIKSKEWAKVGVPLGLLLMILLFLFKIYCV